MQYGSKISVEMVKKALNQADDGIMMLDKNGIVIYTNEAYLRMTQPVTGGMVGHRLQEYVDMGQVRQAAALIALEEDRKVITTTVIRDEMPILVSCSPVHNEDGELECILTITKDQTDFVAVQEEIANCQRQMRQLERAIQISTSFDSNIVAASPEMKKVLELANHIKDINATVIIRGESGTGKDVVARYIHSHSGYADKPFITINCGSVPESLLESELFGYVAGSFTGASRQGKQGLLEAAGDGVLFLDEVGDLPKAMQVKLLRVLENRTFMKVGDTKERPFNARIISATNRDLESMIRTGEFREDLYYRLNVVSIHVPSLRERRDDIVPLALYYLKYYNQKYSRQKIMSAELLQRMGGLVWPGNVRELKNGVERMVIMEQEDVLSVRSLEFLHMDKTEQPVMNGSIMVSGIMPLGKALEETERQILLQAKQMYGSCRKIADALGVDYTTVARKLKRYGTTK